MFNTVLKTFAFTIIIFNLNGCIPQTTTNIGWGSNSKLSTINITLPEWQTVFGPNCKNFIKAPDDQPIQNCNDVTQKLKHYQLKISPKNLNSSNSSSCTNIENQIYLLSNNNIEQKIKKNCSYDISLALGSGDSSKFKEYYKGSSSIDNVNQDKVNVTITLKSVFNQKAPPIQTKNETDLTIEIQFNNHQIQTINNANVSITPKPISTIDNTITQVPIYYSLHALKIQGYSTDCKNDEIYIFHLDNTTKLNIPVVLNNLKYIKLVTDIPQTMGICNNYGHTFPSMPKDSCIMKSYNTQDDKIINVNECYIQEVLKMK